MGKTKHPQHDGDGSPWVFFAFSVVLFCLGYLLFVLVGAAIYQHDLPRSYDSFWFSVDTLACRGRIAEPNGMTDVCKWFSCLQAVVGHVIPGIVFGLLFAILPLKR
jgi:hypothetical protein